MKAVALLVALSLVAPAFGDPDGGTPERARMADADAGIFEVVSAETYDGGTLGPGWWMTPGRMQKVGVHITDLENQNAAMSAGPQPTQVTWGFWLGLGLGVIGGCAGTIFILNQVRK